jgi:hypothetical protein
MSRGTPLFGAGLLTPPKPPTVGLQRGLWRGQETGHNRLFT